MIKSFLCASALLCFISQGISFASGLGFYGAAGIGSVELEMDYDAEMHYWDDDQDEEWNGVDEEYDEARIGLGFVWDTCPARDKVFNYRLEAGFHSAVFERTKIRSSEERLGSEEVEFDGYGITLNHSFGFGLVRKANVRFWLGPAVRLFYERIVLDDEVVQDYDWVREDSELVIVGLGVGPAFGVNFKVGSSVMLSFTGGISYNGIYASNDLEFEYDEEREEYYTEATAEGIGSDIMFYLQFSTLFLSGEDRI